MEEGEEEEEANEEPNNSRFHNNSTLCNFAGCGHIVLSRPFGGGNLMGGRCFYTHMHTHTHAVVDLAWATWLIAMGR